MNCKFYLSCSALLKISRKKPLPKIRVEAAVEEIALKMAFERPAYGQIGVATAA